MKKIYISFIALIICLSSVAQVNIIAPQYYEVRGFSDGLAAVKEKGGWGFIDLHGNVVIPLEYKDVRDFHEGKAAVKTDNGWGYINSKNEFIIQDKYFDARDFSEGFAAVRVRNDQNESYSDGYDGERWGHNDKIHSWVFIRSDGKVAFDGIYRDASSFHDGVACVFNEESWEYINSKGESASQVKLNNLYPVHYSDGLIPNVGGYLGDEWGFSDLKGKWIIPPQYRTVSEFSDGIAVVEEYGGQMKVIDNTGKVLYEAKNNSLILLKGGFILDGQYVFHKTDLVNPYHIFDDLRTYRYYWAHNDTERPDIVMVPSGLPAGVSSSVMDKPYGYIQSVDVQRELKATLLINPSDGLWATEYDNNTWGFTALNMNEFISKNIESRMSQWLKRGEFESTSAYENRTSEQNRQQKMVSYADELVNGWLKKGFDKWTISNYDADQESFVVTTDFGKYTIRVPSDSARMLKTYWNSVNKRVGFRYDNGLYLDKIDFIIPNGNTYMTLCVNTLAGTIEEYDHKTEELPSIEWLEFMSSVTAEDCPIKLGVISKSKINDISITVNGTKDRGIQTVYNNNYDLTISRTLKLHEGANVVRVSVSNAAGTAQAEKSIVYSPHGNDLPSIEWLEFAPTPDNRELRVKLGIKSKTRIENVKINGEQSRGIETVATDEYDLIINRILPLKKGENRVSVSVQNAGGISTSDKVIINGSIKDKRIALVIGNSRYVGSVNSLANPGHDAEDVSSKLESLGFDVSVLYDGTLKQMNDSISSFIDKASHYDVALFYYAGHGLQLQGDFGGTNYLIPTDAILKFKSDAESGCVNANRIVSQMESSGCKVRLVILDACRDLPNLLDRSRGSSPQGFAEIKSAVGTYIMYSTREGRTALDGEGRNSPFAEGILKYLDEPNLPIETFFKKVGDWVDQKTGNKQEPWPSGRIKGDFFFNPK